MKKRLYLIRHAKSDWSDPLQNDFDRPLNERGNSNVPMMGKRLAHQGIKPDLIVSSPAVRARMTATQIAEQIGYDTKKIVYDPSLYLADVTAIQNVLQALPDSVQTVFLIGHNPGLTEFAEYISGHGVDNIPTCGIFEVRFDGWWHTLARKSAEFVSFDYPKKHR